jgi:hypothetical protein
MAGEAQRSVVPRRPLESDLDRRADHGPVVCWGIRPDYDVCWGPGWSLVEYFVPFREWNGSKSCLLDPLTPCIKQFTDFIDRLGVGTR